MHGGHHHNNWKNILEDPSLEPQQRAYWQLYNTTTFFNADAPNKFFLYSHIFLVISAWAVLYPISVLLSTIPTTSLYLPVQTLQVATFFGSLFCLAIFGATCPQTFIPITRTRKCPLLSCLFLWFIGLQQSLSLSLTGQSLLDIHPWMVLSIFWPIWIRLLIVVNSFVLLWILVMATRALLHRLATMNPFLRAQA